MTILETNETGETVADLSPEPKKRKGRPQPEDQKPTDPNIPPIGTDIWLCEGGVWATKPRKVDTHGVTANGDAFQVAGYSMWLMMKHEGKYWSRSGGQTAVDFSPADPPFAGPSAEAILAAQFADSEALVSKPSFSNVPSGEVSAGEALAEMKATVAKMRDVSPAFPTGEISRNPEERTLPIPGTEEPAEPQEPSKKLECAISRHKHLTPDIERFATRLLTWESSGGLEASVVTLREAWLEVGQELSAMHVDGRFPKVTARSRLRSWLRPRAPVTLREDIAGIYAQMYSQEELSSLEVMAVLETKVALRVRGGRELGLVELAHVRKP